MQRSVSLTELGSASDALLAQREASLKGCVAAEK